MKLKLRISHESWTSLSIQQQAEQRAKYEVTVAPAYAPIPDHRDVAPVAKEFHRA